MCSWYKETYHCSSNIINYVSQKYGWYNLENPCDSYTFSPVYFNFLKKPSLNTIIIISIIQNINQYQMSNCESIKK